MSWVVQSGKVWDFSHAIQYSTQLETYESLISEFFLCNILDHDWPWVTATNEYKIMGKEWLLYSIFHIGVKSTGSGSKLVGIWVPLHVM